ncbi:biopolymer transporter ExbD [Hahella sp. CCB-MM4]|uniref:ExbD/TolR family protein n=1 Tax=Hahella sp. (strain CCB-MM4) TaxID=1926491 RepID=UPI000B9C5199|nr:biopolymer transporter ExbD [Hahella sp. CCB-MM4]OZG73509.1 biopolymer transporter ExbD [Hahella sp. CCB-MM4]
MRRKHRRPERNAELDITAFMNLMIVLVPVLLINLVFAQTSVLDLNFPESTGGNNNEENLQLQAIILDDRLIVADNKGGVIKQIPKLETGEHDFALLSLVAKDIKARLPEKRDITIMPKDNTSYQTLVTAMDTLRSYRTVVAGSVVNAELFPDISIADAPEIIDPMADAGGAQ